MQIASKFAVTNSSNTKFLQFLFVWPINKFELIFQLSKMSHTYLHLLAFSYYSKENNIIFVFR